MLKVLILKLFLRELDRVQQETESWQSSESAQMYDLVLSGASVCNRSWRKYWAYYVRCIERTLSIHNFILSQRCSFILVILVSPNLGIRHTQTVQGINLGSIGVYMYLYWQKLVSSCAVWKCITTMAVTFFFVVLMEENPQVLNKTKEQSKLPKPKSRTKSKKRVAKSTTRDTELRWIFLMSVGGGGSLIVP